MTTITRRVVHYAAQECSWQVSGELSVAWMIEGWYYAHRYRNRPIQLSDVLALGAIIEPGLNRKGLRKVPVRVGYDVKMDPAQVTGALDSLLEHQPPIGSQLQSEHTEWFRLYENIHPFRDGNGRTGSLLYNWLRGTLQAPIHAPNLWHDPRRDVHGYPLPVAVAAEVRSRATGLARP